MTGAVLPTLTCVLIAGRTKCARSTSGAPSELLVQASLVIRSALFDEFHFWLSSEALLPKS